MDNRPFALFAVWKGRERLAGLLELLDAGSREQVEKARTEIEPLGAAALEQNLNGIVIEDERKLREIGVERFGPAWNELPAPLRELLGRE